MSAANPDRCARRWAVCAALALAAHVAVLVALTRAHAGPPPPPAIPVELELVSLPTQEPLAVAPPPATQTVEPASPPAPQPLPPQPAETTQTPVSEAKPVRRLEPQRRPGAPPRPPRPAKPISRLETTAREPVPAHPEAARPIETTVPAANDPNAVPVWQGRLVGQLGRAQRYPNTARADGEEGVAVISFTLDRAGQVLAARLVRSSGSQALDEEAVALVRRAAPLPPPPLEMPGAAITVTVPIRFSLE